MSTAAVVLVLLGLASAALRAGALVAVRELRPGAARLLDHAATAALAGLLASDVAHPPSGVGLAAVLVAVVVAAALAIRGAPLAAVVGAGAGVVVLAGLLA